jgi:hypothetical protein
LAGCGSPPQVIAEEHGKAQPLVELATADLQERLAVSSDEIALQSVKATDFPDASLGVPEPGKMYAQVITPGYVIRLVVNGAVYEYHGSGDRVVSVPTSSPTPAPVYQEVNIPEAGLVFGVPAGWLRLEPEWAWAPDGADSLRIGVNWMDIQPPQEVEAAMLPTPSQVIHSEPIELDCDRRGQPGGHPAGLKFLRQRSDRRATRYPRTLAPVHARNIHLDRLEFSRKKWAQSYAD